MTDGTLFFVHMKNLKKPKQGKGNIEGVFCDFPPFLAYHHLSNHTENTLNFESYILGVTLISHYFMSDRVFLLQRSTACAEFP